MLFLTIVIQLNASWLTPCSLLFFPVLLPGSIVNSKDDAGYLNFETWKFFKILGISHCRHLIHFLMNGDPTSLQQAKA
jgi:hypothetical protein